MPERLKILVYGGSFDPPHEGHAQLLAAAARAIAPDSIHVFPAYHSPFKRKPETPAGIRLALARTIVPRAWAKKTIIDDFEIRRKTKTYTYQSLRFLSRKYPDADFFLLMGSDCMAQFDKWKNCGEIASSSRILVGMRKGFSIPEKIKKRFAFSKLPGNFPEVSSTRLRALAYSTGKPPAGTPAAARGLISREKLYGLAVHGWLKKNLSPARYRHTLSASALALRLASAHGADESDAALAGLLHDCAKSMSRKRLIKYAGAGKSEIAARQPALLHSFASARLAREKFGVKDKPILSAMARHTLGAGRMSLLEKIVYVSDIACETRAFPAALAVRKAALRDIDEGVLLAARAKLRHVLESGKWFCPEGLKLWNSLAK